MHAVFQPARAGRTAAEANSLSRIENIVDGEKLVLGQRQRGVESNQQESKKLKETSFSAYFHNQFSRFELGSLARNQLLNEWG